MVRRILILTTALLAVGAAVAGAQPAPTWNSGYNGWWPGGFGYPPATVQARGFPCSVTAYGPTFHSSSSGWIQDYGSGTSCTRGFGTKTATISAQVLGQDGRTWHTISGSTFTSSPSTGNPMRIMRTRQAYLGHVYRTVAVATLIVPAGHAGCSLTHTCSQMITISAFSRRLGP